MFARKPALATPASAPAPGLPAWTQLLANPFVGAGAAAFLLLAALGGLVLVAGDPQAGAPRVRVALQGGDHGDGAELKRGLYPGAPGPEFTLDNLLPGQELSMPGAPDAPVSGEAVITLPQGATLGGGGAARPAMGRAIGPPLPTAPIAGLTAPGPGGLLPIIGPDGKTPFQAYSRPFRDNGKPRVALVVGGLGLNAATTRSAIDRLPPEVTLSFVPYADGLQGWIDLARANGHEVMLEAPMEPADYPNNDPGPYTLMASAQAPETIKRLEWLMSRATGYFAVTNYLGGKFLNSDNGMSAFLGALKSRGLGFIDDGGASKRSMGGVPRASADALIDEQLSAEAVERKLLSLEAQALQKGSSLGAGFAYPVTLDSVVRWAQGLPGRGYQLAPASAVVRR